MLYETVWQASEPLMQNGGGGGGGGGPSLRKRRRSALRFRSRRGASASSSSSPAVASAPPRFELLHSSPPSSRSEVHAASRVLAAVQSSGVLLGKRGGSEGEGLCVLLRGGEASAAVVPASSVSSSASGSFASSSSSAVSAMIRVVSSEAPATSAVNVLSLDPLADANSVDAAAAALRPRWQQQQKQQRPPLARPPPPPPLGAFGPAAASGNALFSARLLRRAGGEGGRVLPSSAVRLEPRPRGALANLRAVALPNSVAVGGEGVVAGASTSTSSSSPSSSSPPLLPPGAVRLSVLAAGLNFRDVLNVLDMYPAGAGDPGPPGADVVGVVEAVGPPPSTGGGGGGGGGSGDGEALDDPLRPGDLVLGLSPGCLGPGAVAPASLLVRFPLELVERGMTAAEAATLPTAFATAILAFDAAAGMTSPSPPPLPCALPKNSRALIHAGAGGVGMAALRLASAAGVSCIATASSPERRQLARGAGAEAAAGSRDVSFVDSAVFWPSDSDSSSSSLSARLPRMALSSLISPGFVAATLACLAGRGGGGGGESLSSSSSSVIEISKRGIWSPGRVAQERPDVAYEILAIDLLPERKLRAALQRVLRFAAEASFSSSSSSSSAASSASASASASSPSSSSSPASSSSCAAALPATVFPMRDARRALRELGAAKHAGKVVLVVRPAAAAAAAAKRKVTPPCPPLPPPPLPLPLRLPQKRLPSWVVTGGLGALGGLTARWLCASQGARRVVLASRDAHGLGDEEGRPGEPEGAARAAARGTGLEAEVSVVRCDAAAAADVASLLEPLCRSSAPSAGGGGGGIAGIVHSGGALADAPVALVRPAALRAAAAAKAPAARNFASRLAAEPLLSETGIVAFTSTAALLGAPGQAAYAAANGAMDSVLCCGSGGGAGAGGERALSLQWGGWSLGMAARGSGASSSSPSPSSSSASSSASSSSSSAAAAAAVAARMRKNGMTPLDAELGLSALAAAMRGPLSVAAASGEEEGRVSSCSLSSATLAAAVVDWPLLLLKGKGGAPPPLFFSDLVEVPDERAEETSPLLVQPAVESAGEIAFVAVAELSLRLRRRRRSARRRRRRKQRQRPPRPRLLLLSLLLLFPRLFLPLLLLLNRIKRSCGSQNLSSSRCFASPKRSSDRQPRPLFQLATRR